jgi:hypothetical protein
MRLIYQKAKAVLIWLGPDTPDHQAAIAINSLRTISEFLCQQLGFPIEDLSSRSNVYHEVLYKNRSSLPLPDECEFSTDAMWKSLVWFYSHPYFTRVWIVQEVNASRHRLVYCGQEKIEWDRIDLVAGYIIMDTAFSKKFGFSKAHCWWAATVTTERMRNPENWLFMLYLASNFSCLDERDMVFGLRGLMRISIAPEVLDPDYSKSTTDVYRETVEAAFVNFQNTDVLLYLVGDESPSWIPRWNKPMLFRNPFRFGKSLPWRPAGKSKPVWSIDKNSNVLSLSGFAVDHIKFVESYDESLFGSAILKSDGGRDLLSQAWGRILKIMEYSESRSPFTTSILSAAATAFSFGLDAEANPADESQLLRNFIAYLKIALSEEMYNKYIPLDASEESKNADGNAFGKPVWDFRYPESGFFITENGLVGCSVSPPMPGDVVYVALGSTYPSILRPHGDHFLIKGYAFVHGIMRGERRNSGVQIFKIY